MWSSVRLIIIVSICGTPLEAILQKGLTVYLDGVQPIPCSDKNDCRTQFHNETEVQDMPMFSYIFEPSYPDALREKLADNYEENRLTNSTGHLTIDSFREALEKSNAADTVEGFIMLRRMRSCEFVNDIELADGMQGVLIRAEYIHVCSRIRRVQVSFFDAVIRCIVLSKILRFVIKSYQFYEAYHFKKYEWPDEKKRQRNSSVSLF